MKNLYVKEAITEIRSSLSKWLRVLALFYEIHDILQHVWIHFEASRVNSYVDHLQM